VKRRTIFIFFFFLIVFLIWNRVNNTLNTITDLDQEYWTEVAEETSSGFSLTDPSTSESPESTVQYIKVSDDKLQLIAAILRNHEGIPPHDLQRVIRLLLDTPDVNFPVSVHEEPVVSTPLPIVSTAGESLTAPISIVLVGKDTRKKGTTLNTDVIILAILEPEKSSITLLSLPRDLGVKIPGYKGLHKINSAFAKGEIAKRNAERRKEQTQISGPLLLKQTIEQYLGIPVHYFAMVDFQGFIELVDMFGGVEVNVDRRLVYHDPTDGTNIDLKPGRQTLNGKQALDFVRHRHDDRGTKYYSSDFTRNERQQQVLRALADKISLFDLLRIEQILQIAEKNVKTDIPKSDILKLIQKYIVHGSKQIVSLPNNAYWDRNSSFSVIPDSQLTLIKQHLRHIMGIR